MEQEYLRKRSHQEVDSQDSFAQRRPFGSTQEESVKRQKIVDEEDIQVVDLKQQKALR